MTEKILCGACEKGYLTLQHGTYKTKISRIEMTLSNVEYMECNNCHEKAFTGKQLRKTEEQAKQEYRNMYDLLDPRQIQTIREDLKLTQKELSYILGCGEANFSRWENGNAIQSKFVDNMLRVFHRYPEVIIFLKERSNYPEDNFEKSIIPIAMIEAKKRADARRPKKILQKM